MRLREQGIFNLVWAVVAIVVAVAVLVMTWPDNGPAIKVGQVWQDGPVAGVSPGRRKVLDVRDGYVKYERVDEDAKGFRSSMSERVFRARGAWLTDDGGAEQ